MAKQKITQNTSVPKRVKMVAKEHGLPAYKLAELVGISQQQMSKIMNGIAPLTINVAEKIHEFFPDYDVPWLLVYTDVTKQTKFEMERVSVLLSDAMRTLGAAEDLLLSGQEKLSELSRYVHQAMKGNEPTWSKKFSAPYRRDDNE